MGGAAGDERGKVNPPHSPPGFVVAERILLTDTTCAFCCTLHAKMGSPYAMSCACGSCRDDTAARSAALYSASPPLHHPRSTCTTTSARYMTATAVCFTVTRHAQAHSTRHSKLCCSLFEMRLTANRYKLARLPLMSPSQLQPVNPIEPLCHVHAETQQVMLCCCLSHHRNWLYEIKGCCTHNPEHKTACTETPKPGDMHNRTETAAAAVAPADA